MTKIEEVIRLVKEDGDIIAEAVKVGSYWELAVTFDSKEAVLEYLDFLNQEYQLITPSEFPTTLETAADFDKAPVGTRWSGKMGEYECRADGWYWREDARIDLAQLDPMRGSPGYWIKLRKSPSMISLPLQYLEPEV